MAANPSASAQGTRPQITPNEMENLLASLEQVLTKETSLQGALFHLFLWLTDLAERELNPEQVRRAVGTAKKSIARVQASLAEGRYPEISQERRGVITQILELTDLGNLQGDDPNPEVLGTLGRILAVAIPLTPTGQGNDDQLPRPTAKVTSTGSVTAPASETSQHGESSDSAPSISFSPEAYAELERIARQKGKPVAAIVRDALALEKWFDETRGTGGRVLVERNGRLQELVKV
jgi:hypothetical protein